MPLLPKDERFFKYFHQQSDIMMKASALLVSGLKQGYDQMCQICSRVEALERSCDDVTHEIHRVLQSTFITPFDPEDIHQLSTALDDVVDAIEDATFRIVAYRLDPIPAATIELAEMIADSCAALGRAMHALDERRSPVEACIEVNRLEGLADAIERSMLTQLFISEKDPITLMKLKDVYELLESATDRCEDVADLIQNVAVKNS